MDCFWAANRQRLLCGGDCGEASVKTRPTAVIDSAGCAAPEQSLDELVRSSVQAPKAIPHPRPSSAAAACLADDHPSSAPDREEAKDRR
jgi:hypothetical protein